MSNLEVQIITLSPNDERAIKQVAAMTTLAGVDFYPNVLEHSAQIRNLCRHPYEFYQKLGFVIAGVMPDANGRGKPDIFLAKPVISPIAKRS